jgi:hypothetical protein
MMIELPPVQGDSFNTADHLTRFRDENVVLIVAMLAA